MNSLKSRVASAGAKIVYVRLSEPWAHTFHSGTGRMIDCKHRIWALTMVYPGRPSHGYLAICVKCKKAVRLAEDWGEDPRWPVQVLPPEFILSVDGVI